MIENRKVRFRRNSVGRRRSYKKTLNLAIVCGLLSTTGLLTSPNDAHAAGGVRYRDTVSGNTTSTTTFLDDTTGTLSTGNVLATGTVTGGALIGNSVTAPTGTFTNLTGTTVTGTTITGATGSFTSLSGNLTGNVTGDVTGNVTGDVTGNLTGDVTGNVTGDVTGNVTGDVTGNLDTGAGASVNGDTVTGVTVTDGAGASMSGGVVTANTVNTGDLGTTGNALVGGSLGVTGTTTTNGITNTGSLRSTGRTLLLSDALPLDPGTGGLLIEDNHVEIGVINASNHLNGMEVTDDSTTITGGTASTTQVLDDNGVSFTDSTNGQTFAVSNDAQAELGNATTAGSLTVNDGAGGADNIVLNGANGNISATSLNLDADAVVGGTLDVTGATTLNSTLGVTGQTSTNGLDNTGDITNTGDISTATLQTSGLATLDSAQVDNDLNVDGATTTNGITNTGDLSSTSTDGSASLNVVDGSASLGVINAGGHLNGITADETSTTISGGTASTTQVLDDNGVSYTDSTNGETFAVSNSAQADLGNDTAVAGSLTIHDGAGDATTATVTADGMLVDDGTNTGTYGANGVTITGGPEDNVILLSAGLDNGNNKVINVAAGELSDTSTDAVNGSQLYATGTSTATNFGGGSTYDTTTGIVTAPTYVVQGDSYNNVGSAIGALDDSVTRLDIRLDRVGAMSAALSGVQPISFNGENPMQVGIAGGVYNGEYAVALGLNAYASERVLFNVGGAMSGSEAMGRAGISIALGSTKPKAPAASTSEVVALRNVVNTQSSQIHALMRRLADLENKLSQQ